MNKTDVLDTTKKAAYVWNNFSVPEREEWKQFFNLSNFSAEMLEKFPHYRHSYNYHLTNDDVARIIFCAVVEIVRYNKENNMHRVFIGNSGGLDSATTLALYAKASALTKDMGGNLEVIAFGLPIDSNPDHNARAIETSLVFGVRHVSVEHLDEIFVAFKKPLEPLAEELKLNEEERRRAFGNVKARIRMIINFFGTAQSGSYVASTDNLSELYMAFWTLMGDVGGFGPIQNILKGLELPAVSVALGVPERTLGAKPTDGLQVHKSLDSEEGGDTDAFRGVYYPHLDAIICHAAKAGFDLSKQTSVRVDADKIDSPHASQEIVDKLVAQMSSPASVWKRTKGSIGTSIAREDLGLPPVASIVSQL